MFWPFKIELPLPPIVRNAGVFLLIGGLTFGFVALRTLKGNLSPSLKPKVGGELITTGLYSIVRHPAYGAIIIFSFGLSFWIGDGARLMVSACLLIFFGVKSKMEEKWLEKTYPEYGEYKKRVTKKFIPWLF
jgi:protein-S-isoprenylcysteine O-methyltransferase Ste14